MSSPVLEKLQENVKPQGHTCQLSLSQLCFHNIHLALFACSSHLIHHFRVHTCYVYVQCGPRHRPLCRSHSNFGVHHWLDGLWIFKFLKEITWLTSVQWKTSLHLIRALPYQLIMARSGDRSFDKMAVTCRRHGRATEETQKLQKGGVDSSR